MNTDGAPPAFDALAWRRVVARPSARAASCQCDVPRGESKVFAPYPARPTVPARAKNFPFFEILLKGFNNAQRTAKPYWSATSHFPVRC